MARTTRLFSDFDLNFTAHPVTGDVTRKLDEDAIKASVRNLILTNNYERPFHSEIGIQKLLFENATPLLAATLKQTITNLITAFEPRVVLLDVQIGVKDDENSIFISIYFRIINTEAPIKVDMVLERTR